MVPDSFTPYFAASAGAGAALIGLLFVAVSINAGATFGSGAHPARKGVASAAFTALANAFFVSMWALIPLANAGLVTLAASVVDVVLTVGLGRGLLRDWRASGERSRWGGGTRVTAMLVVALALYSYEAVTGLSLLLHPHEFGYILTLAGILLGVYALGLGRAWELLGAPRAGLSRWLNPLQSQTESAPKPDATPAPRDPSSSEVKVQPSAPAADAPPPAPGAPPGAR